MGEYLRIDREGRIAIYGSGPDEGIAELSFTEFEDMIKEIPEILSQLEKKVVEEEIEAKVISEILIQLENKKAKGKVKLKEIIELFKPVLILQFPDADGNCIHVGDILSVFGKDAEGHLIEQRFVVCFGLFGNGEKILAEDRKYGNGWYLQTAVFLRDGKPERFGNRLMVYSFMNINHWLGKLRMIGNVKDNPELLCGFKLED